MNQSPQNLTDTYNLLDTTMDTVVSLRNGNLQEQNPMWQEKIPGIKIKLLPHQKTAIYRMIQIEKEKNRTSNYFPYCLYSDAYGSGKTITILALISASKPETKLNYYTESLSDGLSPENCAPGMTKRTVKEFIHPKPFIFGSTDSGCTYVPATVIICNYALVKHWKEHIAKYFPNLKAYYIETSKDILIYEKFIQAVPQFDVILVKSSMYNQFCEKTCRTRECPEYIQNPQISEYHQRSQQETIEFLNRYSDKISQFMTHARQLREHLPSDLSVHTMEFLKDYSSQSKIIQKLSDDIRNITENVSNFMDLDSLSVLQSLNTIQYVINVRNTLLFDRVIYDDIDCLDIPESRFIYAKMYYGVSADLESCTFMKNQWKRHGFIRQLAYSNSVHFWDTGYLLKRIVVKNRDSWIQQSAGSFNLCLTTHKCFTPYQYRLRYATIDQTAVDMVSEGRIQEAVEHMNIPYANERELIPYILEEYIEQQKYAMSNLERREKLIEESEQAIQRFKDHNAELEQERLRLLSNASGRGITDALQENSSQQSMNIINIRRLERNNNYRREEHQQCLKLFEERDRKMKNIQDRLSNISEKTCPVCLDIVRFPSVVGCCENVFCTECILESYIRSKTCPTCRSKLSVKSITMVYTNIECNRKKNKLQEDTCIEMIKAGIKYHRKYIVYGSPETNVALDKFIRQLDIPYRELIGTENAVNSIIDQFNREVFHVLVINPKRVIRGINLTCTTDIVFFGEEPEMEQRQLIGTCLRIGRKEPLNVHYLIHDMMKDYCPPRFSGAVYDEI